MAEKNVRFGENVNLCCEKMNSLAAHPAGKGGAKVRSAGRKIF